MASRFLIIVPLFLVRILSYGQNSEIRESYQDGTIKHLQRYNKNKKLIEEAYYDPYGKLYSKEVYSYSKNLPDQTDFYNAIGINLKKKNEYNNKKQLIKVLCYDPNDSLKWFETYKYDKRGNKTEQIGFEPSNVIRYRETYRYDDNNNLIECCRFLSDGTINSMSKYKYDHINRCVEEQGFLKDDKLDFINKYEYDKSDHKIKELIFSQNENNLTSELLYFYTPEGWLTRKEWYQKNELVEKTSYHHDPSGNVIEEIVENSQKILSHLKFNPDGLPLSEHFFHSSQNHAETIKIYDNKGNIIEESEFKYDSLEYKLVNRYDSLGNIQEAEKIWGNARKSIWQYSYDEKGRKSGWRLYGDCNQLFTIVDIQYENDNRIFNSIDFKDGMPVESNRMIRENGKEISQCVETNYYKDGLIHCKKRYNHEGKESEVSYYQNGIITSKYTYTYDGEKNRTVKYDYDNNGTLISENILK